MWFQRIKAWLPKRPTRAKKNGLPSVRALFNTADCDYQPRHAKTPCIKLPISAYVSYLAVASFLFGGVTLARYVSNASGSDSARVAKFACSMDLDSTNMSTHNDAAYVAPALLYTVNFGLKDVDGGGISARERLSTASNKVEVQESADDFDLARRVTLDRETSETSVMFDIFVTIDKDPNYLDATIYEKLHISAINCTLGEPEIEDTGDAVVYRFYDAVEAPVSDSNKYLWDDGTSLETKNLQLCIASYTESDFNNLATNADQVGYLNISDFGLDSAGTLDAGLAPIQLNITATVSGVGNQKD